MRANNTQKPSGTSSGIVEFDGGLRLSGTSLWLDARRPVPLSFLSNALAFRHQQRLVTSTDTVQLLSRKLGTSDALPSPIGRQFSLGELILELVPAGTVIGSAQLLITHRNLKILYCGTLRLEPGWLGEPSQIRQAEVLVLDCEYDASVYRFPPRAQTARELLRWVKGIIAEGDTPTLVTSELGTAQEVCHLLNNEGIKIRTHRRIAEWNRRVRACGQGLGPTPELRGPIREGEAAVVPSLSLATPALHRTVSQPRFALVSGLAVQHVEVRRAGAEIGFPLSCHADSKALRSYVRDTGAKQIYLGPRHTAEFATSLRRMGFEVIRFEVAAKRSQLDLFRGERG